MWIIYSKSITQIEIFYLKFFFLKFGLLIKIEFSPQQIHMEV